MTIMNYYPDWKPQEDIIIRFDDKTAEPRTIEQIDQLFKELREVANEYDFDLKQWGSDEAFGKYYEIVSAIRG